MKKALALILTLIMVLGLMPAAMAVEVEQKEVKVEKVWNCVPEGTQLPKDVQVKIYAKDDTEPTATATLEKDNDGSWGATFTVPASFDVNNAKIEEEVPFGYTVDYTAPSAQAVSLNLGSKITPAKDKEYNFSGNIIVANHGGQYYIWTETALTVDQQTEVMAAINRANLEGLGKTLAKNNTTFKSGNDAMFTMTQGQTDITITITAPTPPAVGKITFSEEKAWSLFYAGMLTIKDATNWVITNTYTENTVEANGSLTIKKEFGSDSAITADNWAGLTNNKQLTFTITKAGATAGTTVTLPTNDTTNPWTYTVNNLPVGEYTVTETGAEDGYGLTVTNKTDITTAADGNTGTVKVTDDSASTITFTNTYEKINADLVVYKNVTGNRGNYSSKAFTFRLTLTQPTFEVVAAGNVAQAPVNSAPPEINYSSPWYRIVRQDGTKEEGSVTVGMALEFNLGNGERLELYANGDRYDYEVKETNSLGHDTTVNGNDKGTIDVEKPTTVTFNNYKSGGGHYYPTPDPVPPIVIPPKTGDMTIWQSILHFLGIR